MAASFMQRRLYIIFLVQKKKVLYLKSLYNLFPPAIGVSQPVKIILRCLDTVNILLTGGFLQKTNACGW